MPATASNSATASLRKPLRCLKRSSLRRRARLIDMTAKSDLVCIALTSPQSLPNLSLRDWDLLIRQGRSAAVLGRLHAVLEEDRLLDAVPQCPRNHLNAARVIATSQERVIRWEVQCIERALR